MLEWKNLEYQCSWASRKLDREGRLERMIQTHHLTDQRRAFAEWSPSSYGDVVGEKGQNLMLYLAQINNVDK